MSCEAGNSRSGTDSRGRSPVRRTLGRRESCTNNFHYFPQLPVEIQDMIWDFALECAQANAYFIDMHHYFDPPAQRLITIETPCATPAILGIPNEHPNDQDFIDFHQLRVTSIEKKAPLIQNPRNRFHLACHASHMAALRFEANKQELRLRSGNNMDACNYMDLEPMYGSPLQSYENSLRRAWSDLGVTKCVNWNCSHPRPTWAGLPSTDGQEMHRGSPSSRVFEVCCPSHEDLFIMGPSWSMMPWWMFLIEPVTSLAAQKLNVPNCARNMAIPWASLFHPQHEGLMPSEEFEFEETRLDAPNFEYGSHATRLIFWFLRCILPPVKRLYILVDGDFDRDVSSGVAFYDAGREYFVVDSQDVRAREVKYFINAHFGEWKRGKVGGSDGFGIDIMSWRAL